MIYIKLPIFLLVIASSTTSYTRSIIPGNAQTDTKTFTFPIAQFKGKQTGALFVSAGADGAEDFALSGFSAAKGAFIPLAPEMVTLDGKINQKNPLFNSQVRFMGLFEQDNVSIVATRTDTDPTVYLIDRARPTTLLSQTDIADAAGEVSSGIIALEGSSVSRAYVAVKPHEGEFGDAQSGINVIAINQIKVEEGDAEFTKVAFTSSPRAARLDTTVDILRINSNLSLLQGPVCMQWDKEIKRLFVGVGSVTAGAGANDGVRSIVVGSNELQRFVLVSLFHANTDFTDVGTNKIIVATGSNTQLSVHHCASMPTTTNKRYLIVVGGNGSFETTKRSVFAIPLAFDANRNVAVADKNNIAQPALLASQMVESTDTQALVGGGDLPAGDITSLSIRNETIFVTVQDPDNDQSQKAGVYFSRPLFKSDGTVKAWSAWQRATSQTDDVFASSLELVNGDTFVLTSDDPNGAQEPNTITRTQWGEGDERSFQSAVLFVGEQFPQEMGGVHNVCMFTDTVPGLEDVSLMTILGNDRVALVQTGIRDGVLIPTDGDSFNNTLIVTDGTITETPTDQTILQIQGGALEDVGPFTTSAIAHNGTDTWVCVAGTNGVAVLRNEDGTGIGSALGQNFSGITEGMRFMPFGEYTLVQKLVADNSFLYVLTDTTLYRIDIRNGIVDSSIEVIALIGMFEGLATDDVFIDCIISGSLGLLGTSGGLFRIADGARVTDVAPAWQKVVVPEGEVPVMDIRTATQSGNEIDVAKGTGGHIYVLTGNAHNNRSVINRFAIEAVNDGPVTETTVQPITADHFFSRENSVFINYGEYKDMYATDGALTFAARNIHAGKATTIVRPSLGTPARSENMFTGINSRPIEGIVPNCDSIMSLEQNSASGAWTIGGTMGLRVNE